MLVAISEKCSQNLLTVAKKHCLYPQKTPTSNTNHSLQVYYVFFFLQKASKSKKCENNCPNTMVNVLEGSPTTVFHAYPQLLTATKTKLKHRHQKVIDLDEEQN